MDTRIIGIDLAVKAAHKAIVLDQSSNRFVSKLLTFHTDPAEIDRVLLAAGNDAADDVELVAVMEATGMSWFSVGVYLHRHDIAVDGHFGQIGQREVQGGEKQDQGDRGRQHGVVGCQKGQ